MASTKIVSILEGVSCQAKSTAGVWRDLAEDDLISHQEEILVNSDGPQFGVTAYKLQQRVGGEWVDALSITLNVTEGTSHYRQDRIGVTGDDTDSTAEILVTVDRGQMLLRDMQLQLEANEWNRFSYPVGTGATPVKYRGNSDDLDHATKGEYGMGLEQEYQGSILCSRRQFGAVVPEAGKKLLWSNGKTYRIDRVKEDEISYLLDVISVSK